MKRSRFRARHLGVLIALLLALNATVVALQWGNAGAAEVAVTGPTWEIRGTGNADDLAPVHGFIAAQAVVPSVTLFSSSTPAPEETGSPLANPTHEGFPLVFAVIGGSSDGQWLQVRVPARPNNTVGWIRATDVMQWEVPNRIEVSLSENTLRVYRGSSDQVLFQTLVATGAPRTPTPVGNFFIDIVVQLDHHPVYGWGQLSVSGFSEVLQSFGGGIGQIAIHGWNNPSVMGRSVSNGCIRMNNDDIAQVYALAPLGTPVDVIP